MKKILRLLVVTILLCVFFPATITTYAKEDNEDISAEIIDEERPIILKQISQEEMDRIISADPQGNLRKRDNWFEDNVLFSIVRENDGCCKVTFLNDGFIFDRCDVDGFVTLYDSSGKVVGNKMIAEHKLVFHVARVVRIYPIGGSFSSGAYSFLLSDGGQGNLYTGTF